MTGYIYICRREHSTSGLLKIGHTDNLDRRMSDFDRETGADSRMVIEFAFSCPAHLRESIERKAHRLAANFRRRGEWFELDLITACEHVIEAGRLLGVTVATALDRQHVSEITRSNHIDRLYAIWTAARDAVVAGPKPDIADLIEIATNKRHRAMTAHLQGIRDVAYKVAQEKAQWIPRVAAAGAAFAACFLPGMEKASAMQGLGLLAISGAIAYFVGTFFRDSKADKVANWVRAKHDRDIPPAWAAINAELATAEQARRHNDRVELERRYDEAARELQEYLNPDHMTPQIVID